MALSPNPSRFAIALAAAVGLSACAVVAGLDQFSKVDVEGDDAGTADVTIDEGTCTPACSGANAICDPASRRCVECLSSATCGPGLLCFDNACKPGCSASHPECAPDAGRCDIEAGVCRTGCITNADCTDPTKSVCDVATGKCTECLPSNDSCQKGRFCAPASAGEYQCVLGCTTVSDCAALQDGGASAAIQCCNHICIDTSNDVGHCGACNTSCVAGGGSPGLSACCNSTCFDLGSTPTHCGTCSNVCSTNHVPAPGCSAGSCSGACALGFADCNDDKLTDGCETETQGNVSNCGGCGQACSSNNVPTPTCAGGECNGACAPGFADCNLNKLTDGCESNLASDPQHCGGCANACSNNHIAMPTCSAGVCDGACAPGYADCDNNKLFNGCEVDLMTDSAHCGGCGAANVCPTGSSCVNGACQSYTESTSTQAFIDACTTGTPIAGSPFLVSIDDGNTPATPMPLAWSFYGQAQSNFWLDSNGVLGFGTTPSALEIFSCPLPTTADPVQSILAFADDLYTGPSGICVSVVGTAPNRQMVVTWEDAHLWASSTADMQFSVILTETSNTIDIVYNVMTDTNSSFLSRAQGTGAVVGLQNAAATLATTFSCKTQSETPGTAIRFTP